MVPDALLEHWTEQLRRHLNLNYFSDDNNTAGRGVVYLDGIGDLVDARTPLSAISLQQVLFSLNKILN